MKLTRNLFPLLYQLMLIICDVTVDSKPDPTPEEVEEKKKLNDVYKEMLLKQKKVLGELESAVNMPIIKPE